VEDVHNGLRIEKAKQSHRGSSRASSRDESRGASNDGASRDREVPRRTEHEGARRASGSSASQSESESGRGKNGGSSKNAS